MDKKSQIDSDLRAVKLKLDNILRDNNTKLPTLPSTIERLREEIELYGLLGIIVVLLQGGEDIESIIEWKNYDKLLQEFAGFLSEFKETHLHPNDLLIIRDSHTCEFLFAISASSLPNGTSLTNDYIVSISQTLKSFLDAYQQISSNPQMQKLEIELGHSRVLHNPVARIERQIYSSIEEAKRIATHYFPHRTITKRKLLSEVIANERINTQFQAIVFLNDLQHILGYEALSSGPIESSFDTAEMLFTWAERLRLDLHLDIVCRKKALQNAVGLINGNTKLFLNTNPRTIENPRSSIDRFMSILDELKMKPENIILEITERTAIDNFDIFEYSLARFRDQGFGIAIDDAGAGYASLNSIARLRPDFLKFDMALVRNIDRDLIKQELLFTMMDMAERISSTVIAEGIETETELNTLQKFQVPLGQGFFISRPIANPKVK